MYLNAYQSLTGKHYRKVNFHTHSGTGPNTCGKHSPEEVIAMYREFGYELLCLSNHNLYRDYANYSDKQLTLIDGVEYTSDLHMLNIGVKESFLPKGYQETIGLTNECGGFTILCHPNWPKRNTFSADKMLALKGYTGIEVLNGVCFRLTGSGRATDVWDEMLSRGILLTGFANDDFHLMCDAGRFFNLIACEENNYTSMKQAIDENAVCASSGLYPVYHIIENGILKVKAELPGNVFDSYEYRFIGKNGKLLKKVIGEKAECEFGNEDYVRCEVTGEGGHMILFQPVYKDGSMARA